MIRFALVFILAFFAFQPAAFAQQASDRAATGGAQTVEDIMARQRGEKVPDRRRDLSDAEAQANALTVRLELMADCMSGIWASNVKGLMERGDLQEALNAARKIGDDHLQRQAGRVPQPHTFTHGTSAQRARWFERGYATGLVGQCDTFAARQL